MAHVIHDRPRAAGAGQARIAHMKTLAAALAATTLLCSPVFAETGPLERDEVTLGFLKVTDMAPLAVAFERGFFADEGLIVHLEKQDTWRDLLNGVVDGRLDGGQMLSGQPLAAAVDFTVSADIVVPYVMSLNGNAITVSNAVWAQMRSQLPLDDNGRPAHPISAEALNTVIGNLRAQGQGFTMSMVSPMSPHNFELRYWLAAGGINPGFYAPGDDNGTLDADLLLAVTPPPKMPETLGAGAISGFSVGEPWNRAALMHGVGVPVISDAEIFARNPEKVFGITARFAEENPNTTRALVRALIRAGMWLDEHENGNRPAAVEILAMPEYLNADPRAIEMSLLGTFEFELGDVRETPDFNIFFRDHASYPFYSDAIWTLTQMRRWGQIAEPQTNEWYQETAASVYRPDIYMDAAQSLIEDSIAFESDFPYTDGYRPATPASDTIDGVPFDARKPNEYIDSFPIGLKAAQQVVDNEIQG
jgi:nitrate/nitrite transport system substrate-binding protein